MEKIPAIIADLDGTLYDARERQSKFLTPQKKDFDGFHRAAKDDLPHWWCAQLLQAMRHQGFRCVFTSGRDDTYREETDWWLRHHLLWQPHQYELHMRPAGDFTADDEMKRRWYQELIEPMYQVLFCVDDRRRVVDMWRSLGLTCLHCAVGEF